MPLMKRLAVFACLAIGTMSLQARAQRVTVPLDGTWSIADSVEADAVPASFTHTVAVPGLVHSATPRFPLVDEYLTHEFAYSQILRRAAPPSTKIEELGRTSQTRKFYWYERSFRVPARKQRAMLVVNKAQFGTAVWLNGKKIGEHSGCFTAGHFDLTDAINWTGENRLLIRIGAHLGAVPPSQFTGSDGEKEFWTPGIYDSVSLQLSDNLAIDSVQVAPRIQSSDVLVETELTNHGPARTITLSQRIKTWKGNRPVGKVVSEQVTLAAGEHKFVRQTVPVPNAELWTLDRPFLYVLDSSSGDDSAATRFGMRELHFADGKAILNGKVVYMRGASITLHRFFADPESGSLPWDDAWVRKVLIDIPRRMNWNSFRICVGPAPQRWLDIADEAGLLIDYEFPMWDDREPLRHEMWDKDELLGEYKEFVRDNWNHPSLVIFDASNEMKWPFLEKVVHEVRKLDLSNRPWENSFNPPDAPTDPYEVHPYRFVPSYAAGDPYLPHPGKSVLDPSYISTVMTSLDKTKSPWDTPRQGHAAIINEYELLWLHRDGRPTTLTQPTFDKMLDPGASADQYFFLAAYLTAGLTEHWRSTREYAGVLYLAYIDGEGPHVFTCDNFRNVKTLEFQPYFEEYMKEAYKPLGVNLKFWKPTLPPAGRQSFHIILTNDLDKPLKGELTLTLKASSAGDAPTQVKSSFSVPALGQSSYDLELSVPAKTGAYQLEAAANCGESWCPTISRRQVKVGP